MKVAERFKRVFRAWSGQYDPATTQRRHRQPFYPQLQDERHQHDKYSRQRMMTEARWLYDWNPLVRGAVDTKAKLSAGSKGFTLQARTADPDVNQAFEEYWTEWQKVCDVRGMFTWPQMLKLSSKAIDVDGEIYLVQTSSADGATAQLQAIVAHRCDDDPKQPKETTQGILLNPSGRPIAYRFKTDGGAFTDVDARNVLHLFDPLRFDQLHGQSGLASALRHLRDLDDLVEMEKLGAKTASSIALLRKTASGEPENPYAEVSEADVAAGALPTEQQVGGAILYSTPDGDVQAFTSNRPSPAWQGLVELLVRDVCISLDLPYEFVVNPSRIGGTAQRAILQKVQQAVEDRQQILLKASSRIYGWVIAKAIKAGRLPAIDGWWRHEWTPGKGLTVDFGREANAFMAMYRLGLMTADEFYGLRGMDWQDQFKQKAVEAQYLNRLAAELGVSPQQIQLLTPNASEAPPADSTDGTEKDKTAA